MDTVVVVVANCVFDAQVDLHVTEATGNSHNANRVLATNSKSIEKRRLWNQMAPHPLDLVHWNPTGDNLPDHHTRKTHIVESQKKKSFQKFFFFTAWPSCKCVVIPTHTSKYVVGGAMTMKTSHMDTYNETAARKSSRVARCLWDVGEREGVV